MNEANLIKAREILENEQNKYLIKMGVLDPEKIKLNKKIELLLKEGWQKYKQHHNMIFY